MENKKQRKIKSILLINDTFPPVLDGVANTVVNYQRVLTDKYNINAVVLTPKQVGGDYENYPYPVYAYNSIDTEKSLGYRGGVPFSPKIMKELKKNPPELIHVHCPITSMTFAIALRKVFNVPIVLTYHTKFDIDITKRIKNKLFLDATMKYVKAQLNLADEVWSVSKPTGENLKKMGYKYDYLVMENGIDMENTPQSQELIEKHTAPYLPKDDRLVFLFIGRQFWYKGFNITLEALGKLKKDGVKFTFVSIGDGTDLADIKKYAKEIGLEDDDIKFLGQISDREILRAWYSRADLFLLPSTYDCNPLVVLEAAANHTASILIKNSDSAQKKTDGVNTFLIEENAESMYQMLKKLSGNRELIKQVGENASRDLYVSWEKAIEKAVDRYQTVIDNYKKVKKHHYKSSLNWWIRRMGVIMRFFSFFATKIKKKDKEK